VKTVRASEIGAYLYCQRAWWFQRQGYKSSHQADMETGAEMHYHHGKKVLLAGLLRLLAYGLLLAALASLVAHFTGQFF
jgi:hypothetical protein